MRLKIAVSSKSLTLQTDGEIYTLAGLATEPPVVNDVKASNTKDALFALEPGVYVYEFAIQSGMGALTVKVHDNVTGNVLASDDFDTRYGYYGNDLKFEVR